MTIKLLTQKEAAEILGIRDMRHFYNLKWSGVIPENIFVKIPGIGKRIRDDRLQELIKKHSN